MGRFFSGGQTAMNAVAIVASMMMLTAAFDLRAILRPIKAPEAVAPGSPSPFYLWVSLDTAYARYFQVVLESDFWANRRVPVASYGGRTRRCGRSCSCGG